MQRKEIHRQPSVFISEYKAEVRMQYYSIGVYVSHFSIHYCSIL